jgi:hypothetical protein
MSAQLIGRVKSGKYQKSYEVKWNPHDRHVYVSYAGWTKVGLASSASQAMNMAEGWLHDK